jgi:hypothetical protein
MRRRPARANILSRIEELERRFTDQSCLVPNSPEWLVYWDRQIYNFMTDQEHAPLTLEAVRANMRYSDNPASLVGSLGEDD